MRVPGPLRRSLLAGLLVLGVAAVDGAVAGEVADALRQRAARLEKEMAALHEAIQSLSKGKDGPQDLPEIERLQEGITERALEVARLKLEAQRLDASPSQDPMAAGLWGPAIPRAATVDLTRRFGKIDAGTTAKAAAAIVRTEALADLRPAYKTLLTDVRAQDVLVVKGSFDKIGLVLDALRVPYMQASPWELTTRGQSKLEGYKIVLWNCGEAIPPARAKPLGKSLRAFVQRGGFLFTTDWSVLHVLPHAFPGTLETKGPRPPLPEMIVSLEAPSSARDSLYLRGVLTPKVKTTWWLEEACFDIEPKRTFRGVRLLRAPDLLDTFERSPAAVVVFAHGKGRVMHTLGHTYQEQGNLAGAIAAQRLLLDFLLMAQIDPDERPSDGL